MTIDTAIPTARGNIEQAAVDSMWSQFKNKPNITAFIRAHAIQQQRIETMFLQLWIELTIEYASGLQLDKLGALVLEDRRGLDDSTYKAAIRTKIRINRSNATANEVIDIMRATEDRLYHMRQFAYASMELELVNEYKAGVDADLVFLAGVLKKIKAAGVRADIVYHERDNISIFTSASGDSFESSSIAGAGNDAETTGGHAADYYD